MSTKNGRWQQIVNWWRSDDKWPGQGTKIFLSALCGVGLVVIAVILFDYVSNNYCVVLKDMVEKSPPWALITALAAVPTLLLLWYWRDRHKREEINKGKRDIEIARDGQITDRFTNAIKLLGDEKLEVRLGGIYALERIAKDSKKDHFTVMEALAAFVRYKAPWRAGTQQESDSRPALADPSEDVQAALTVIARRNRINIEEETVPIQLYRSDLRKTYLDGAFLRNINFWASHLEQSSMLNADLNESWMELACFDNAVLDKAKLEGANLCGTLLRRTSLRGANLRNAKLSPAPGDEETCAGREMVGRFLYPVEIDGSFLAEVDLEEADLSWARISNSTFWATDLPQNISHANLKGITLKSARLINVHFLNPNLQNANFEDANLFDVRFAGAELKEANFNRCHLFSVSFEEANLESATLERAVYDELTIFPNDFGPDERKKRGMLLYCPECNKGYDENKSTSCPKCGWKPYWVKKKIEIDDRIVTEEEWKINSTLNISVVSVIKNPFSGKNYTTPIRQLSENLSKMGYKISGGGLASEKYFSEWEKSTEENTIRILYDNDKKELAEKIRKSVANFVEPIEAKLLKVTEAVEKSADKEKRNYIPEGIDITVAYLMR